MCNYIIVVMLYHDCVLFCLSAVWAVPGVFPEAAPWKDQNEGFNIFVHKPVAREGDPIMDLNICSPYLPLQSFIIKCCMPFVHLELWEKSKETSGAPKGGLDGE